VGTEEWGITVGKTVDITVDGTLAVITVGETVDITVDGTLVVTMGRIVVITGGCSGHRSGGFCHSGENWSLVGWVVCTGWTNPTTHVISGQHVPQIGSKEPRAGGVDPPVAATLLNGGLPKLTDADRAWAFGVC